MFCWATGPAGQIRSPWRARWVAHRWGASRKRLPWQLPVTGGCSTLRCGKIQLSSSCGKRIYPCLLFLTCNCKYVNIYMIIHVNVFYICIKYRFYSNFTMGFLMVVRSCGLAAGTSAAWPTEEVEDPMAGDLQRGQTHSLTSTPGLFHVNVNVSIELD